MTREEFSAYADASIEAWRAEGIDARLLKLIEVKANSFMTGRPPAILH